MGEKKWYVVNTYSGYENRAMQGLQDRARAMGLSEQIGQILIPTEQVVELRKGERKTSKRKFFPGYILVEMELTTQTWHLVKSTPKITGFVGGTTNPPSIPEAEVMKIANRMEEGEKEPVMIHAYAEGDRIKVIDGPFSNFSGVVEMVDEEKRRLRVLVQIFGRDTPVELDFAQVEKT